MSEPLLPEKFGDLEPFADWALEPERARTEKRVAASMEEIRSVTSRSFERGGAATRLRFAVRADTGRTRQVFPPPAGSGAATRTVTISVPRYCR